ncbi:HlyD family type I secretion periplasmic adaptor subunit [Antarcticirhabdus aurantiaca]|uniref:HlyD family type I secretion periplasmic adaptor subunit n=1 Tax=Antarcticirhabdus aurantiaca TaxID=2606717 RepID=A0ACD4NPJ0_9HYPH|nr:HlyD family type I secretion periplasmic adaptor subunit [Antarcticirhabdus aurantiaca]WAJ28709.1 HlyD family type I secretion periplasmic adaptor subunit [Jeongeuplla avenae]
MTDETAEGSSSRSLAKLLPTAVARPVQSGGEEVKDVEVVKAPVSARGPITFGLVIILVTFFGAGVWASTAPLAGAVAAPGTVIVAGKRRAVQHLEGGIVKALHVLEGQEVKAGDLLITLDETQANATVTRLRTQLDTQLALEARLSAEQSGADAIEFPAALLDRTTDPKVGEILAGQRQEFDERQKTLVGTVDLLNQKIGQLHQTIDGLGAQKTSKEQQVSLIREELGALDSLLRKGLTNKSRVLELQRAAAQLDGEIGEISAQIGRSQQQISEAEMQIIQTRQQFREDVVAQLRTAESKAADLQQQLFVASDVAKRLDIRASQSGTVQNLVVTTIGGVIAPGEVLMEIAPKDGDFLVEAQVSPLDIDSVNIGQVAEVRFSALDLRTTPVIMGKVVSRSGDRIEQNNRAPYFRVQIETPPEEMAKLKGRQLQAGMPAEALIQTGERTLMNYLTKPLTDQINRGMKEQ